MVPMHLISFTMPVVVQIRVTFITPQGSGDKVNRLSNIFKNVYDRHTDLVGQYKKYVCQMLADCTFFRFVKAELIKLAKMAGVMHEADHAYPIWSTW